MQPKQQTKTAGLSDEYRISSSPQAVMNKWITIGVLAVVWLSLVISLLQ